MQEEPASSRHPAQVLVVVCFEILLMGGKKMEKTKMINNQK